VQLDEPTRFGDVWTLPLSGEKPQFTRVTHLFDRMEREFALPRQEKVTWKSTDGTTIEGLLFYPVDYQRGTKYPLVVQLHGGPMESDKFGAGVGLLQHYFPVLAGKGYAVFRPNYRGSAGYGNAFYRDVVGHFFNQMQHDVLTGVDHLVQMGVADPDRVVAMGWSAGGHLANKLITMTDRFKAASSGASVANWMSFYSQTDVRSFRVAWFGGEPWQKNPPLAAFWDHSPLKDASNVKTPTLLFAGEADDRVPLAQSLEMYRALKGNGVATHLYVAPRDGHMWQELRHLLFKANAELEWFEHYARGRSYTWEKAPQ
jgi:dipeptidyl aminopeptidase/acylaminoacyl peptidase